MADISKREFKKICEMQIKMKVAYCYLCGQPILNNGWTLNEIKNTPPDLGNRYKRKHDA